MIQTVTQLNRFSEKAGVKTQAQLLPALIDRKELISASLAKLITDKSFDKLTKQP